VDVGRETYTAQTFGKGRYDLWFTRGNAHNAPVVNGVEQKDGRESEATAVEYRREGTTDRLSMHLERAYPREAGLWSLRREVAVSRAPAPSATIRDVWTLAGGPGSLRYTFYAAGKTERAADGTVLIDCGARKLALQVQPPPAGMSIEAVPLDDPIMRANWGEQLYRIVVDVNAPVSGTCAFTFRARR
jgi:hypothetical protein